MLSEEHYGVANFRWAGGEVMAVDVIHATEDEESVELIRLDASDRTHIAVAESKYEDGVVVGYAATPMRHAGDETPIAELREIRYNPENGEWWTYLIKTDAIDY